ncbi:MAG: YdcF family protein [Clostridia bacterium]|nr:YdcF family protein [Clostridia bacterium]
MGMTVLAVLGLACILGLMGYVYYMETHLPPVGDSDVIIVLGAQVKEDGTPSVALQRRLTAALESYQADRQMIIVCGAQGGNEPRAEGDVMREWLLERGVPDEDVVAETESFNTRENLMHARAIMAQHGLEHALVVTSDYHVARALALCRQVGISAVGKGSPSKPEYFIKNHFREGLSWIKFWLESMR